MESIFYLILIFIFTINYCEGSSDGESWGYSSDNGLLDPSHWNNMFPTCGGVRQSPIDIVTNKVIYSEDLKPINITSSSNTSDISYVSLEKHKTSLYLLFDNNWKITFGNKYCLKPVAIHWHWGSDSSKGAEHLINGYQYPIEGHLVSFNCDLYSSISNAISSKDGLFVIGMFYKIGQTNKEIQKILDSINPIVLNQTNNLTMAEIKPLDFLPKNLDNYYRYDGSLTTPPCTENVVWTVLKDYLTISEDQMGIFRNLEFESPLSGKMVNNIRPVLPIDYSKRPVYSSFKQGIILRWNKFNLPMGIFVTMIIIIWQ